MVNMHKDEGGVRTKTYLQTHLKGDKSPRMPFFNTGTRDTETQEEGRASPGTWLCFSQKERMARQMAGSYWARYVYFL